LNVFEVSQEVHAETHGMFFAEYFPHSHYALEGLRATQAFLKLASEWRNDMHALHLRSWDPDVGLEYLSTVGAVLAGTTGLVTMWQYTSAYFQHEEIPLQRVKAAFRGSWDQDWQELASRLPIHFPKERGARKRHLPFAFIEASISRVASDRRSGLKVIMRTVVDNVGNTEWALRGKLSKLDWSCVPEDLRVFVDKPIGDAITDEAAKAVRIIKELGIKT
jgi:hypothetical protein